MSRGWALAAKVFGRSGLRDPILTLKACVPPRPSLLPALAESSGLPRLSGCTGAGRRSISALAPARWIGSSTFRDSLPKPCPSCPLALMKDRAVYLPPYPLGMQVKSRE